MHSFPRSSLNALSASVENLTLIHQNTQTKTELIVLIAESTRKVETCEFYFGLKKDKHSFSSRRVTTKMSQRPSFNEALISLLFTFLPNMLERHTGAGMHSKGSDVLSFLDASFSVFFRKLFQDL